MKKPIFNNTERMYIRLDMFYGSHLLLKLAILKLKRAVKKELPIIQYMKFIRMFNKIKIKTEWRARRCNNKFCKQ